MEAQEDQHNQARPELSGHVENMDDYDTILLGERVIIGTSQGKAA